MRLITLKQGAPPVIVLTAAELQVVYYVSLGWLDKEPTSERVRCGIS